MKKVVLILTVFLSLFITLSCSLDNLTFDFDLNDYFKKYTEEATVGEYVLPDNQSYTIDKNGVICLPSDQDFKIKFYLMNSQNYPFTTQKNMTLSFNNLIDADGKLIQKDILNKNKLMSEIENRSEWIVQDENDTSTLILTLPKEFLYATECGGNISPTIQLRHPVNSDNSFPPYSELKLVSNSPPPSIYGPVVYSYPKGSTETYVLIFNMPSQGLLKDIHKDMEYITISRKAYENGKYPAVSYTFPIGQIDENGKFASTLTASENASKALKRITNIKELETIYIPLGTSFDEHGQGSYFETGDILSDDDITYTLTLTDKWGLQTSVDVNAKSVRLADVKVFANDKETGEKEIPVEVEFDEEGNIVGKHLAEKIDQDEDSSYATVCFAPADITHWFTYEDDIVNRFTYYTKVSVDETTETENIIEYYSKQNSQGSYKVNSVPVELNQETGELSVESKRKIDSIVEKIQENEPSYSAPYNLWEHKNQNTSNASIIYEVYQGKDDTGTVIFNSKSENGRKELKLPGGELFVRVYAHLKGFADTIPLEFGMEVLRTTVFVSKNGLDSNTGSSTSPFATIKHALESLSYPDSKKNTLNVLSDIDLSEGLKLNSGDKVKICGYDNNKYKISSPSEDLLILGDDSELTLENLDLNGAGISVGKNAKLRLNNVNLKLNNKLISMAEGSVIELCGSTDIYVSDETPVEIKLDESAVIRVADDYKSADKHKIEVSLVNWKQNVTVITGLDDKPVPDFIYSDFRDSDNNYVYFGCSSGVYYLDVADEDEYMDNNCYKKGVLRKSGAVVDEPVVGKFDVQLLNTFDEKITCVDSIYYVNPGDEIQIKIISTESLQSLTSYCSGKKLSLLLEGMTIESKVYDDNAQSMLYGIPENLKPGNYLLQIDYSYDKLTYSEIFVLKMEAKQ